MTDSKTLAEAIGALLCREGKEADLKARFDSYMDIAKGSGSVAEVANYPIQRYYGRTLVHVAAFNGLPQYLDQLLKNGGTVETHYCTLYHLIPDLYSQVMMTEIHY